MLSPAADESLCEIDPALLRRYYPSKSELVIMMIDRVTGEYSHESETVQYVVFLCEAISLFVKYFFLLLKVFS